MRATTHILRPFIGKSVVYFDDILVYRPSKEAHMQHLMEVLDTLRKEKFYAKTKKCCFMTDSIVFLGYVVSKRGDEMDPFEAMAISDWPMPTMFEIRSFHGLASL